MVINPIIGVYIPIIRIPIKGWMTIPNTRSLDPGSYQPWSFFFTKNPPPKVANIGGSLDAKFLGTEEMGKMGLPPTEIPNWSMVPANWGMDYATYHLLWEPKATMELDDLALR